MALVVFWASVGSIVYAVAGLPLLLAVASRVRPRPHVEAPITPPLTMVIAAHNEEAALPAKLDNVRGVDYPDAELQIIVASDGSTDGTVAVARAAGGTCTLVLDLPRTGKAGALNAGLARATGDIVVFTDANSMLAPGALRALVRPFADPSVGGVAGNQVYTSGAADADVAGERAHWAVDRRLKEMASRTGSIVSATGALYAVRRELVPEVIDGVTDDFYVSTNVVVEGRRLVFAPDAVVWEPVAASADEEYARKERVMTRGFRAVLARRSLLDPRRHGLYAVQLFSYKVLRRLLALPVTAVGVSALFLWRRSPLYRLVVVAQVGFWSGAVAGHLLRHTSLGRRRLLALPAFVGMSLVTSVRAAARVLTGREISQWTPARAAGATPPSTTGAGP